MVPLVSVCRFMCAFLGLLPQLYRTMWHSSRAEIANQTLCTRSQWRLARQVGAWRDAERTLFCGIRLHKHHYHLTDLESLLCSAATPILSGTSSGYVPVSSGNRVKKKEWVCGMCVLCVSERVRIYICTCADSVIFLPCCLEPSASFLQTKFFWLCGCQI